MEDKKMKSKYFWILPLICSIILFCQLKSQHNVYNVLSQAPTWDDVNPFILFWYHNSSVVVGVLIIISMLIVFRSPAWSTILFLILPISLALYQKLLLFPVWIYDDQMQFVLKIFLTVIVLTLSAARIKVIKAAIQKLIAH